MPYRREPGTWDAGLDYEREYRRLLRLYRRLAECGGARGARGAAYAAVLLLQLRNGLRISEAVHAALLMAREGRREVHVKAKKRNERRLVVLPDEVEPGVFEALLGIPEEKLVQRIKEWCRYNLGYNTHSLRYAFITRLHEAGVSPAVIAKITGHRKLDRLITYTQKKEAEEVLRWL